MNNAESSLKSTAEQALQDLFSISVKDVVFQKTRREFEGDLTLVTFPFVKTAGKSPDVLGNGLGEYFVGKNPLVVAFNVVKGFLNLTLSETYWLGEFNAIRGEEFPGKKQPGSSGKTVMVEFASPNTNKPLHLGHVRNILLGHSVSKILEANGHTVIKTNLINDRGIHICKSMLAWQRWGQNETPQSSGMKGDHLVGKYYVAFDKAYRLQQKELMAGGIAAEEAEQKAPLILEAREMLRHWENGDKSVIDLWKTMNGWVYEGFGQTFSELGVSFDKIYYESDTYLLGRDVVREGLDKHVFYKKENGSVAIDLSAEGLDEKIVLRSDGTSVYITQDLGTAIERFREYEGLNQLIYTVGNEQDYHFKVLFSVLAKLGYDWAKECYHLSYGMVELPEGKMKSREGTVVDADELLKEMNETAAATTKELGKVEGFSEPELQKLYSMVSLGALKYFILKVDPRKKMLFDPKESIDFNGHTGPFIQYTHARIRSVLRRATADLNKKPETADMNLEERAVLKLICEYSAVVEEAGNSYSPAQIANHLYELTKAYNRFYHEHSILNEENENKKIFRLQLSLVTARVLSVGMDLLGIEVPERM